MECLGRSLPTDEKIFPNTHRIMKEDILKNLEHPQKLEQMYRSNKSAFKREFNSLFPQMTGNIVAECWNERLNYEKTEINWGTNGELVFVVLSSLVAGFLAKVPALFNINEEIYYTRNIGFIVFPLLAIYFAWKNNLSARNISIVSGISVFSLTFMNLLPHNSDSDTLILSCIHLPFILWAMLGFVFTRNDHTNYEKRLDYLRYNGDLVVITTVILIAGMILSGITIALFSLIEFEIEEFYLQYIVVWGLAASPIVGTYVTQTNPQLVSKVSPVIARIFSPLVLVTLFIYLIAILISGQDPYNDREFLMIFNLLLIGVMAIVVFSVIEASRYSRYLIEIWILFALSVTTIIVNVIALSAIIFRISEWGITPNRLAVLGGNLIILTHLLIVTYDLYKVLSKQSNTDNIGVSIASYLPFYVIWAAIVTFVFPFVFGFR